MRSRLALVSIGSVVFAVVAAAAGGSGSGPGDLNGEVHHDGQIWSRALWDIRKALGNVAAHTTIIEAHFDMPNPTMPQLAATTVAVAKRLYGNGAATKVKAAFVARGILQ